MFTVLDLFCGCGGMTQGLKQSGLDVKCGVDVWDTAISSYKKNHEHTAICADIINLEPQRVAQESGLSTFDVIVGGFPCPGYSMAGRREVTDPRNTLFMEMIR